MTGISVGEFKFRRTSKQSRHWFAIFCTDITARALDWYRASARGFWGTMLSKRCLRSSFHCSAIARAGPACATKYVCSNVVALAETLGSECICKRAIQFKQDPSASWARNARTLISLLESSDSKRTRPSRMVDEGWWPTRRESRSKTPKSKLVSSMSEGLVRDELSSSAVFNPWRDESSFVFGLSVTTHLFGQKDQRNVFSIDVG